MKQSARFVALLAALGSLSSVPAFASGFSDARAAAKSDVENILGPGGLSAAAPSVDDARNRLQGVIEHVASVDRSPRDILTMSQKIALLRAGRDGSPPDLGLSDDQKTALRAYFADLLTGVLPIVKDDGGRIDATLSPAQRSALDASRKRALASLPNRSGNDELFGPVDALASDSVFGPGAYVLVMEIDLRSLIAHRR